MTRPQRCQVFSPRLCRRGGTESYDEFALVADLSAQHIADQLAGLSYFGQGERTVNLLSVAARGNYAGRLQNRLGNILQPDECWMLDGRLPTVSLRMNRQSKNAQRVAEALHGHKHLSRVIYPTLQCAYPGGIFSIEVKGGKPAAFEFLRHVRIARNAVS